MSDAYVGGVKVSLSGDEDLFVNLRFKLKEIQIWAESV